MAVTKSVRYSRLLPEHRQYWNALCQAYARVALRMPHIVLEPLVELELRITERQAQRFARITGLPLDQVVHAANTNTNTTGEEA